MTLQDGTPYVVREEAFAWALTDVGRRGRKLELEHRPIGCLWSKSRVERKRGPRRLRLTVIGTRMLRPADPTDAHIICDRFEPTASLTVTLDRPLGDRCVVGGPPLSEELVGERPSRAARRALRCNRD